MVEADGEWHTSDNKYGSTGWKATHAPAPPKQAPLSPRKSPPKASTYLNGHEINPVDPNGKQKANVEIVVLDSDDEDEEGRVKRELSPSIGSGTSAAINRSMEAASLSAASQPQADVIDLTLDSDEDDEPPPPSRTAEKRKAPENSLPSPTEQIWKKARIEPISPTVMNGHVNGLNGTIGSSHVNGTISPSALNALHMQPVHYDPLRDAQHAQSSVYAPRLPSVPRPPVTVTSPPMRFGNPTYRSYLSSNSPPPPPPPPRPRQPSSGGHLTPRGRDFSSFGGASSSRWS
jgi:E3 SUMO-protein ligase PIAS1